MRFDTLTLRSTSHRFNEALRARKLALPLTKRLNTWAQIVVGKDHSAAISQAEAHGAIAAVPLSAKRLQDLLGKRGRVVSHGAAGEIFAEAIGPDLLMLSEYLFRLLRLLQNNPGFCLIGASRESLGLGVVDADHPGYLPVSQLRPFSGNDHERDWLRASAELIADTINCLAGYTTAQVLDIRTANMRKGFDKEDDAFTDFVKRRGDGLGHVLAARLLARLDDTPVSTWDDLDYDDVRDEVYECIAREISGEGDSTWLKPDCSLADAVIDHLAAQLRETLRYAAYEAADTGVVEESYADSLAHTARVAIGRIVR